MTAIYFAFGGNPVAVGSLEKCDWVEKQPKILASFFYIKDYRKHQHKFHPTHTMLDSGAYSAWHSGKSIDIDALIEESKSPYWKESVCLDVIGNSEKSVENSLYMKSKGSPSFPVFHIGDPWEHLKEYCDKFPKVGLSCRFGEAENISLKWLDNCFARAWPHKFHSFGWIKEGMLEKYPFHSADASSWILSAASFGTWRDMGKLRVKLGKKDGQTPDVMAQIDSTLRMERRLQSRWRKELARFDIPKQPQEATLL